jgi:MinD-like ATPase involved in chromosome partitioning or flagellar assembly
MLAASKSAAFNLESRQRLATGLERLKDGGVDALLLDLGLPDSQGLDTFERVHQAAPGLPVVVMSNLDDEQVAIRAVEIGAQDYLIKGRLDSRSLTHSLLFAVERQRRHPAAGNPCKVLAFVGAKGGVGTTTLALNIASCIALNKKSVVAVELRSNCGTFAPYLNHQPLSNVAGLLDMSAERLHKLDMRAHLVEFPWGLKVLFGPQSIEDCRPIEREKAEILLNRLVAIAEYLVLDLPDATSVPSQVAACHANRGVLVLNNDPVGVICGRRVLDELCAAGISRPLLKAVAVNRAASFEGMKIEDLAAGLNTTFLGIVTPAADLCRKAEERGLPFILVRPNHLASEMISEITSKLLVQHGVNIGASSSLTAN